MHTTIFLTAVGLTGARAWLAWFLPSGISDGLLGSLATLLLGGVAWLVKWLLSGQQRRDESAVAQANAQQAIANTHKTDSEARRHTVETFEELVDSVAKLSGELVDLHETHTAEKLERTRALADLNARLEECEARHALQEQEARRRDEQMATLQSEMDVARADRHKFRGRTQMCLSRLFILHEQGKITLEEATIDFKSIERANELQDIHAVAKSDGTPAPEHE